MAAAPPSPPHLRVSTAVDCRITILTLSLPQRDRSSTAKPQSVTGRGANLSRHGDAPRRGLAWLQSAAYQLVGGDLVLSSARH